MSNISLYCNCCNYQAKFPCEFNKHLKSQKHLRKGVQKEYNCDSCEYYATTHWNLKMHCVIKHYTIEQKKELKYYCSLCDNVNFSNLYYTNHLKSTLHKNNVIINEIPDSELKLYKQAKQNKKINIKSNINNTSQLEINIKTHIEELFDKMKKEILSEIKCIIKVS